jgi:hypothetical protein
MKRDNRKGDWLYNYSEKKRLGLPDLGYRIIKFRKHYMSQQAAALRIIIEMRDPARTLAMSGYSKRFNNQEVN